VRDTTKVISGGIEYTEEDLRHLDPVSLRGLLHERVHHAIEVPIYALIQKWKGRQVAGFGQQPQMVFDVWRQRGFPEDDPGIEWTKRYLGLAEQIRAGTQPELHEPLPTPFTETEMAVVRKLLWGRRSARGGWLDRPVPEAMIEQILEAGRAAPIGCNLGEVRFIVLSPPKETQMIWSDISTENAVIIVICYDNRPSHVVGQDRPESVPQNRGYDCAAACDHMLLMVHALGLSGVWLSSKARTAKQFKERYGLPDHIEVAMHMAFGWPIMGTIKSARVPLQDMMIRRNA
jgi:nitroreductase